MSDTTAEPTYERSVEIFGLTYGWQAKPLTMQGLDGWAVYAWSHRADRGGILESWFLSREHACRWVDTMIGEVS